jgi:hypothetical protein
VLSAKLAPHCYCALADAHDEHGLTTRPDTQPVALRRSRSASAAPLQRCVAALAQARRSR